MIGKLRIHKATIVEVKKGENGFYQITIEYARRERYYNFWLCEGEGKTKKFLKFVNVESIEKLLGKEVQYIASNDLNEPGKDDLWMLVDADGDTFFDIKTKKIKKRKEVKKEIAKFVLSEF